MTEFEVLSLGGSLVYPEEIDVNFLKKFKNFILRWIKKRKKFLIFVGGGKIARKYQNAARKLSVKDNTQLDLIGIFATKLNAFFVKSLFGNLAFPQVLSDPQTKITTNKKLIFFSGWKPGRSTDFDAVLAAKNFGAKRVINLSNIDYVFDRDPQKFKDAKPLEKISFNELLKITGTKWNPGANLPFDPQAIKLAKKEKKQIIVVNGRNLENLEKVLQGKKFKGTIVE